MHHPTDRIVHTTAFVTPVVEHWMEREIAQWVHPMKDRSDDPSRHERTPLPRSYISLWPTDHVKTTAFSTVRNSVIKPITNITGNLINPFLFANKASQILLHTSKLSEASLRRCRPCAVELLKFLNGLALYCCVKNIINYIFGTQWNRYINFH